MRYKGRIVAVHSGRGIEKHRPQVLFDVADFGGVLAHAGKDKFNVAAVKFHKPCLDKPCRIIVPGDTDSFSFSADRFKYEGHNLIDEVFIKAVILHEYVILDIVLDDFLINIKCARFRFLSLPFRRLCRVL